MSSRTLDALDKRPHWVYRCYDREGVLLYIGVCFDLQQRVMFHGRVYEHSIAATRDMQDILALVVAEQIDDKYMAREIERAAIEDEAPLFNKQHNHGRYTSRLIYEDYYDPIPWGEAPVVVIGDNDLIERAESRPEFVAGEYDLPEAVALIAADDHAFYLDWANAQAGAA